MFKKIAITSAAAALFGIGQGAWAGATTASPFTVTASVTKSCTVTTAPSAQTPAYDPVAGTQVDFGPTIAFKCTKASTGIYVSADLGLHATGTQRKLSNGTTTLNYNLYQPVDNVTPGTCAYTTIYDSSAAAHAGDYSLASSNFTSSSTPVTVNICGRIAASQDADFGTSYTDTINVVVYY